MSETSTTVVPLLDALANADLAQFIAYLNDYHERECDPDVGECPYLLLAGMFINALKVLMYVEASKTGRAVYEPLVAFQLHCDVNNLSVRQSLAMLPPSWRERIADHLTQYSRTASPSDAIELEESAYAMQIETCLRTVGCPC